MSDIFISYARSTEAQAKRIDEALRALGYGVWRDDQIAAHEAFGKALEERLAAARVVLVLWSAAASESDWVRSEASRARAMGKLVQATLDRSPLPMPFDQIQCANLLGWNGEPAAPGWRKVIASVGELVGNGGEPMQGRADEPVPHALEPLLAVLSFDNLSGDPETAYFSDGVSEEILQTVARGSDLKVIGRASSFQFRGAGKAAADVAAHLHATHVLDGSVRRSGSRVRIAANLIECERETTLWSDRFDRELSDVFALQDEIAATVAAALRVRFAPSSNIASVDPSIYDLFLRAMGRGSIAVDPEKLVQTIKMLEAVVASAPKIARAWATLAKCRAALVRVHSEAAGHHGISPESVRAAADSALELDAGMGLAYVALSHLEAWASYERREALHRKALDAAPNDPGNLSSMATFFSQVGRLRDASRCAKQASDLDPLNIDVVNIYAQFLTHYDREFLERTCRRWPDQDGVAYAAIFAAAANEDWPGYDSIVSASNLSNTIDRNFRALFWFTRNLREPNRQSIMRGFERTLDSFNRTGQLSLSALTSLYRLGMTDEVFDLIDRASFAHVFDEAGRSPSGILNPGYIFTKINMAMVRDIRFVGVCAKLGLCAYWVKTERWPDCVDEVEYDFIAEAQRLAA